MKIALYGGNFNPPNLGNIKSIKYLKDIAQIDEVVLLPNSIGLFNCIDNPSNEQRLQMCYLAFENLDGVKVEKLELDSTNECYCIDTINAIKDTYENAELILIDDGQFFDNQLNLEVFKFDDDLRLEYSSLSEKFSERSGSDLVDEDVYFYIIKNRFYNAKPELRWLSEKMVDYHKTSRIAHVLGCESEAISLARRYNENEDNAAEAGLLHDITKRLTVEEHLELCKRYGINVDCDVLKNEKLLHSITGCALAKDVFGISEEIYNAIRWHTTGKPNMTLLEKIIYIADYIEPNRDFDGVERLRSLAYEDIDKCMALGLEMSINEITSKGIVPYKYTKEAFDYYART